MTGPFPSSDLTLNPDARHPPFEWLIGIPSDWAMLDTAPATWQRNAERLIDYKFAGRKLPAKERRTVFSYLGTAVAQTQRVNSVLCVLQFGRMSTGELGSTAINLVWHETRSQVANLGEVHDMIPATATTTPFDTAVGKGLLCEQQTSQMPPGAGGRVTMHNFQAFVPVEGTQWMLVLSASAAQSEMTRVTREAVLAMAHSLGVDESAVPRTSPPQSATTSPAPDAVSPQQESTFERVEPSSGIPGMVRGFGTFIRTNAEGTA